METCYHRQCDCILNKICEQSLIAVEIRIEICPGTHGTSGPDVKRLAITPMEDDLVKGDGCGKNYVD